jgi:thiosulfate dehydrogenase/tetrathionate reductase SoxA/TsdA-like protein
MATLTNVTGRGGAMRATAMVGLATLAVGVIAATVRADERPHHALPAAQHGGTMVGLCDGETATEVEVAPGKTLAKDDAQAVSDQLMTEWRKKHPEAHWDEVVAQTTAPPANSPPAVTGTAAKATPPAGTTKAGKPAVTATRASAATQPHEQTGTYGAFDSRDELVWKNETQKFIDEGSALFHDSGKLGGTIGISCDMCHPNASNTHPETYPKYQVQLQRVALLRDMINWCLENPVKAKALPDDSRTLRALEAYIISTRKGQKLDSGHH